MEKENKLKSIFLSLSPVTVIMWLKDAEIKYWKEFGKTILSIIAPLLIIFLMFNTLLLIGTFVIWRWPDTPAKVESVTDNVISGSFNCGI